MALLFGWSSAPFVPMTVLTRTTFGISVGLVVSRPSPFPQTFIPIRCVSMPRASRQTAAVGCWGGNACGGMAANGVPLFPPLPVTVLVVSAVSIPIPIAVTIPFTIPFSTIFVPVTISFFLFVAMPVPDTVSVPIPVNILVSVYIANRSAFPSAPLASASSGCGAPRVGCASGSSSAWSEPSAGPVLPRQPEPLQPQAR